MNLLRKYLFQIKIFKRQNIILFWCFIVSIIICISYILTLHEKELFPGAGAWFDLLFQLAVGFMINFMFYITQVYIPRYKQNIEVNRCILARISTIVRHMNSIFEELGKIYMNGYNENSVTDEYLYGLLEKINVQDRVMVLNSNRTILGCINAESHFTVKEWIISRVDFVEKEIDKIFQYYAQYIISEKLLSANSSMKPVNMPDNLHFVPIIIPQRLFI